MLWMNLIGSSEIGDHYLLMMRADHFWLMAISASLLFMAVPLIANIDQSRSRWTKS